MRAISNLRVLIARLRFAREPARPALAREGRQIGHHKNAPAGRMHVLNSQTLLLMARLSITEVLTLFTSSAGASFAYVAQNFGTGELTANL